MRSKQEIIGFYVRRFRRFYPLFFISCVSIYIASKFFHQNGIVSIRQLLHILTGLTCFVGDMPFTIWYFSMILLFYLVTPLILMNKKTYLKVSVGSGLFFLAVLLYLSSNIDGRVVLYFPIYCLGLIGRSIWKQNENCNYRVLASSIIGSILSVYVRVEQPDILVVNYFIAICFVATIMEISKMITGSKTNAFFAFLSYSSMCAYLFHRQFFGAMQIMFGDFSYWSAYLLFLPSLIIFSYIIQKVYEKMQ